MTQPHCASVGLAARQLVVTMEGVSDGEDEPDVFYDCYDENYDDSLRTLGDNFYQHVADGKWLSRHKHDAGQIGLIVVNFLQP